MPDSPFLCGGVMTACYAVQCAEDWYRWVVRRAARWIRNIGTLVRGDIAVRVLAEILGLDGF